MKPRERLRSALLRAQTIVARYIVPGRRDCDRTVNDLARVLDDEKLVKAMKQVEHDLPWAERCSNAESADGWKPSEIVTGETSKRSS
jgi:hypothetical protein